MLQKEIGMGSRGTFLSSYPLTESREEKKLYTQAIPSMHACMQLLI